MHGQNGAVGLFVFCCADLPERVPVLPLSDPKLEAAARHYGGSP